MKLSKSRASVAALSVLLAVSLVGCGRQSTSPAAATNISSGTAAAGFAKDAVIGVALPQKTSENWVLAEKLFNEQLTAAGYHGTVQFANGGVTEQQNQISAMVTKGAKVIVVGAIDGSQLGTQLKQAKDAGATVIAYDRMVSNTNSVDYHVSFDSLEIGKLQGQSLLDGLKTKKASGPYNIELFAGSPDDANAKIFYEGAMTVLQPKINDGTLMVRSGQIEYSKVVTVGWKPENAQKRMDTLLTGSYTKAALDGVLSPNDTIARTIITSVQDAGKPIPVITGQDSDVESVKLIMSGKQYSTVDKDTATQVAATMTMINDLQAGKVPTTNGVSDSGTKKVPANLLKPIVVTKANAAKVYANNPRLSPLTK